MFTEGNDRAEFTCDPCVEKGNEETGAVGRIRDDEGREQGMGMPAGGAEAGADGDQAVTYTAFGVADQMPLVRAVTAECRSRGMAGGTSVRHGGADILHKGADGMLVQGLDLVESPADVEKKSYHGIVSSIHGGPWLMKQGKDGGRATNHPLLFIIVSV